MILSYEEIEKFALEYAGSHNESPGRYDAGMVCGKWVRDQMQNENEALQKRILELEGHCRYLADELCYESATGKIWTWARSNQEPNEKMEKLYREFCG